MYGVYGGRILLASEQDTLMAVQSRFVIYIYVP